MLETPNAPNGATAPMPSPPSPTPPGPTPPMSQQAQDLLEDKAFMETLEQKLRPKIVEHLQGHPQDLLGDKAFMETLEQKLTQDLVNNKTFTEALAPKLRPKIVEYLHTRWFGMSLALAIVSLVTMGVVYGLSKG